MDEDTWPSVAWDCRIWGKDEKGEQDQEKEKFSAETGIKFPNYQDEY
jgi:hypothetical protein